MAEYLYHLLVMMGIYLMLALSLNLLVGFGGLLCLAHAAFYGIGAYVFALLTMTAGWTFPAALSGAVVGAALAGFLFGLPALRMRGDVFVVTTVAFQMVVFGLLYNLVSVTGGPYGIAGIPRPDLLGIRVDTAGEYVVLVALLASAVTLLLGMLKRSRFGLVLEALRDDEPAAEALGICRHRRLLAAMTVAAGLAGVAGACFASYATYIDPTSFTLRESIFLVSLLLVGGSGNLRGPMVGVAVMLLLPEILRSVGFPDRAAAHLREMLYGLLLIGLMYWRPQGLAGAYRVR